MDAIQTLVGRDSNISMSASQILIWPSQILVGRESNGVCVCGASLTCGG